MWVKYERYPQITIVPNLNKREMKRIFLTILFLCCAGVLPMMAYKVTGKVNYNKKDGTKEPLE